MKNGKITKVIAYAGVASRRKAEQLILEGKVKVNGVVVRELGTKVSNSDTIEVEGVKLEKKIRYISYFTNHVEQFLQLQMIKDAKLSQIYFIIFRNVFSQLVVLIMIHLDYCY